MIREVFDISLIAAVFSILGFIALSVFGGLLEKAIKGEDARAKFGRMAISISFILFLMLGFSLVPIIIGVFIPLLQSIVPVDIRFIADNDMLIVVAFWAVYLVGLIIMLPAMRKDGFFEPGGEAAGGKKQARE